MGRLVTGSADVWGSGEGIGIGSGAGIGGATGELKGVGLRSMGCSATEGEGLKLGSTGEIDGVAANEGISGTLGGEKLGLDWLMILLISDCGFAVSTMGAVKVGLVVGGLIGTSGIGEGIGGGVNDGVGGRYAFASGTGGGVNGGGVDGGFGGL